MVNIANPHDNQGLREILIHRLVAANAASEAVTIAERYPDDFAWTQYGHALALQACGRAAEAEVVLRAAVEAYPKIWKMLHAAKPKKPRLNDFGVSVGGDDEAWLYRERYLELWRSTGALRWGVETNPSLSSTRKKTAPAATESKQAPLPGFEKICP